MNITLALAAGNLANMIKATQDVVDSLTIESTGASLVVGGHLLVKDAVTGGTRNYDIMALGAQDSAAFLSGVIGVYQARINRLTIQLSSL